MAIDSERPLTQALERQLLMQIQTYQDEFCMIPEVLPGLIEPLARWLLELEVTEVGIN